MLLFACKRDFDFNVVSCLRRGSYISHNNIRIKILMKLLYLILISKINLLYYSRMWLNIFLHLEQTTEKWITLQKWLFLCCDVLPQPVNKCRWSKCLKRQIFGRYRTIQTHAPRSDHSLRLHDALQLPIVSIARCCNASCPPGPFLDWYLPRNTHYKFPFRSIQMLMACALPLQPLSKGH